MRKLVLMTGLLCLAGSAAATEMSVLYGHESLTAPGAAPWQSTELDVVTDSVGPFAKVGGQLVQAERFHSQATQAELFAVKQLQNSTALEVRVRGSGGAGYLPSKGVELTLYAALPGQLESATTLTRNLYAQDSVDVARIRVDKQWGAWRLGGGLIADLTQHVQTEFVAMGFEEGRFKTELALYQGQDVDRDEQGFATVQSAKTAAWNLRWQATPATSFLVGASKHWGLSARTGVTLGLSHSF